MPDLRWVPSASEIPAELWEQCFPAPFEGRWWYQALEESGLEEQFRFFYGWVTDQGRSVAIAPAFLMDVPMRLVAPPALLPVLDLLGHAMPFLRHQRTLFIGSPCSDEGRVGMLPGADRPAVLRCVEQALRVHAKTLKAPMRVWKDFAAADQRDLSLIAQEEGLFPLVSFPGTRVSMPGRTKAGYLGSLKSSRRNKLKKKLKAAAASPVDAQFLQQPDERTLDRIFALFWQTYEKGAVKFERLNRRFFDRIAATPQSHFVLLRERGSGEIVAFMLLFALGEQVINKFIGIDYRHPPEWFLYFRLWEAAVEWAEQQGAGSIQSGQTCYAPKIELGHEMVPLTNYCRHSNPLMHWIFAKVARTVNWETLDEDLAIYLKAYPEDRPDLNARASE
jgi:hypothetical protein